MNRKERRAADHAARKAAHKAGFHQPQAQPEPVAAPKKEISPEQLAANIRNAHLSHGPTTEVGRKKVSMNALKTGLTGVQVLLPTDDAALYEARVRDYLQATRKAAEKSQGKKATATPAPLPPQDKNGLFLRPPF